MSAKPAIILIVWLGGLIALGMVAVGTTIDISPIDPTWGAKEPSSDKPGFADVLKTDLHFTMAFAKPIFEPSRRPFRPKVTPKEKVVQTRAVIKAVVGRPTFRLLGVSGKLGTLTALVQDPERKRAQWLAVGDVVLGWTLIKVRPDSALLQCPEQTRAGCQQLISLYPER